MKLSETIPFDADHCSSGSHPWFVQSLTRADVEHSSPRNARNFSPRFPRSSGDSSLPSRKGCRNMRLRPTGRAHRRPDSANRIPEKAMPKPVKGPVRRFPETFPAAASPTCPCKLLPLPRIQVGITTGKDAVTASRATDHRSALLLYLEFCK